MSKKAKSVGDKDSQDVKTIKAYTRLFATSDGKIVIKDLMMNCFVLETTLNSDPIKMGFNEGKRSVVQKICSTISIDIVDYQKMVDESVDAIQLNFQSEDK